MLPAATSLADKLGRKVLAVWVAWDDLFDVKKNSRFGSFIDVTNYMKIDYLLCVSTQMNEPIFRHKIYFVNRFPHDTLEYKKVGRKSYDPIDNPRRALQLWKKMMEQRS
jgi:hypothetical protein